MSNSWSQENQTEIKLTLDPIRTDLGQDEFVNQIAWEKGSMKDIQGGGVVIVL